MTLYRLGQCTWKDAAEGCGFPLCTIHRLLLGMSPPCQAAECWRLREYQSFPLLHKGDIVHLMRRLHEESLQKGNWGSKSHWSLLRKACAVHSKKISYQNHLFVFAFLSVVKADMRSGMETSDLFSETKQNETRWGICICPVSQWKDANTNK